MPGPRNKRSKQKKVSKKPVQPFTSSQQVTEGSKVSTDEPLNNASALQPDQAPLDERAELGTTPSASQRSKIEETMYHPPGPFADGHDRANQRSIKYLNPSGRGPVLSGVSEFLETPYAARPDLDDPVCRAFARHDVLDILRRFLPEELALVIMLESLNLLPAPT